jgi:hypothetical protein
MIESPLLEEDLKDLESMDLWRALHVIQYAPKCLSPLMGLHQRRRAMAKIADKAREDESIFSVYLSRIDAIEKDAWQSFDRDVMETTAKDYPAATAQEVFDLITIIMQDSRAGLDQIPTVSSDDDKKKVGTIRNGWQTCKRFALKILGLPHAKQLGKSHL